MKEGIYVPTHTGRACRRLPRVGLRRGHCGDLLRAAGAGIVGHWLTFGILLAQSSGKSLNTSSRSRARASSSSWLPADDARGDPTCHPTVSFVRDHTARTCTRTNWIPGCFPGTSPVTGSPKKCMVVGTLSAAAVYASLRVMKTRPIENSELEKSCRIVCGIRQSRPVRRCLSQLQQ